MTRTMSNFGRNVVFKPGVFARPNSTCELLELLRDNQGQPIRALGSLHAWSEAASTSGVCIDMSGFDEIQVDSENCIVRVGAGCRIKQLLRELAKHDLTLPSVGLIDEQTIAGATATGTHGSGKQCLSHYIRSIELAHFDEQGVPVISRIEEGTALDAARCSLGLLGIVTQLTIECRPKYQVEEHARIHQSLDSVLALESTHPLQQFYLMPWSWNWFGHHRVETQSSKSVLAKLYRWYCFLVIDIGLHIAVFVLSKVFPSRLATKLFFRTVLPLSIIRNWKVVDRSDVMLTMEHELFRHIEIEVFVQRSSLKSALHYVTDVLCVFGDQTMLNPAETKSQLANINCWDELMSNRGRYFHHYPICIRRVVADGSLISMASAGRDSEEDWYAISFISYHKVSNRDGFIRFANFIGITMARLFGGRCHWGKYNPLDSETNAKLYPRWNDFLQVKRQFDSAGVFSNQWLDQVVR